jgi:hypothetical protein
MLFSSLLQSQQGEEVISKSKQHLSDTGGWANPEQTVLRTADFLPPAILGNKKGALGTLSTQ